MAKNEKIRSNVIIDIIVVHRYSKDLSVQMWTQSIKLHIVEREKKKEKRRKKCFEPKTQETNNDNCNEYITAIDLIWFSLHRFAHSIYFLWFVLLCEHNNNQLYFFARAFNKTFRPMKNQAEIKWKKMNHGINVLEKKNSAPCERCVFVSFNVAVIRMSITFFLHLFTFNVVWITIEWAKND